LASRALYIDRATAIARARVANPDSAATKSRRRRSNRRLPYSDLPVLPGFL
jgi:hypothetical protein